jgi:hypothetical protein
LSESPDPPSTILPISAIAADDTGVYTVAYNYEDGQIYVLKLNASGTALALPHVSYTDLKLDPEYHWIYDMAAKDGVLYLAAGCLMWQMLEEGIRGGLVSRDLTNEEQPTGIGTSKIVALDAATLQYLWEVDWPLFNYIDGPDQPGDVYLGPLRFLGFARNKLYLADAGFQVVEAEQGVQPVTLLGRVVEIDTEKHTMSATGLAGPAMPESWFAELMF